jgi:hypothetical protein
MADITVTFTDDDQAFMIAQASKTKAAIDALEAHKPSIFTTRVHLCENTNAIWTENKLGLTRGTLQGNGEFTNYDQESGGTNKP